jgi:NAD(P)H-flavin reductase/hemoglobin-like flavoprotein
MNGTPVQERARIAVSRNAVHDPRPRPFQVRIPLCRRASPGIVLRVNPMPVNRGNSGERGKITDTARLKESFERVAVHGGDAIALYFYSDWFLRHPELRDLFPVSMAAQRDHLIGALVKIVAEAGRAEELGPFLAHLGVAHRKFGVLAGHHASLRVSFLATLEHFAGEAWTPEVAADWDEALGVISKLMCEAAARDEEHAPAWWRATVLSAEQRAADVTVLTVAADPDGPPLDWLPGQSVAVETPARPRLWRYYSPANPPGDGTAELHVRWIPGGEVSPALTGLRAGDSLRIGPPAGAMTLDTGSGRDILMAAWSTGLAPLKAILGQVRAMPFPPAVHLFAGARRAEGLYDMTALEEITARCPWLTLTPVVAEGRGFPGETGPMAEVIARRGDWRERDVYLAGPGEMTHETAAMLVSAGMPQEQVRTEDFGWGGRS